MRVGADLTRAEKIDASLRASLSGWFAGTIFLIAVAIFVWESLADIVPVLILSFVVVLVAWFVFFLPLALGVDSRRRVFKLPYCIFMGATMGGIAFVVLVGSLVGSWMPLWDQSSVYILHAMITGAAATVAYSRIVRRNK